jgi:hypothetical protein
MKLAEAEDLSVKSDLFNRGRRNNRSLFDVVDFKRAPMLAFCISISIFVRVASKVSKAYDLPTQSDLPMAADKVMTLLYLIRQHCH